MRKICLALLILSPCFGLAGPALFHKGSETFKIVDANSKTPKLRILSGTVAKQALAVAINSTMDTKGDAATQPYVELSLEKVLLTPKSKDPQKVEVNVVVSGEEHDLDAVVFRKDLLAGKAITVNLIPKESEVGVFTVTNSGRFTIQYQAAQEILAISNVRAKIDFEGPMTPKETEEISFSGKAVRQ